MREGLYIYDGICNQRRDMNNKLGVVRIFILLVLAMLTACGGGSSSP
jgi:hypothetical protein